MAVQNIEPFIELGWHTVPLKGELVRREDGSKTEPQFEKGWRAKYNDARNTKVTKLGGVMTGSRSNIIAIDCDNNLVWQLFRSLDPEYNCIFKSLGKKDKRTGEDKDCGTIIYTYDEELPDGFAVSDGHLALDVYSENGFVYLPTERNKTKVAWTEMQEVKVMPSQVKELLLHLKENSKPKVAPEVKQNTFTATCLAPTVKQFVESGKFSQGLFKIITPKAFRDLPQYLTQGFLHPENVPEGRGSEYLSKVSAILGADISIDEELYNEAMHAINDLWGDDRMDPDRLDATITDPMVSGRASVDGVSIWAYDEGWAQHRCILHTKRQSTIELGFDDQRNMYYCIDSANEMVKAFVRDSDLYMYINSSVIGCPKKAEMVRAIPTINVTTEPNQPFGFYATDDTVRTLNLFKRTPELAVLMEPEVYRKHYKKPKTILQYFETLVPDKGMRTYLLRFLKRKLTTYEYSPVSLYFLGVQGSGKDTFVEILEKFLGSDRIAKPSAKEFLEQYNGWILDTYFAQLDEFGNQLSSRDRDEALGKLKAYTGKPVISLRRMRSEGDQYRHNMTIIHTANKNPFALESDDRRLALFETPNKLADADWVDDVALTHDKILAETVDFAFYLATEIAPLPRAEYVQPPWTDGKHRLIANSMKPANCLAYALDHNMVDYLHELAEVHGVPQVSKDLRAGRLYTDSLEDLYDEMTDNTGEMRVLTKMIRGNGIKIRSTTIGNLKKYYYDLPWLEKPMFEDEEEAAHELAY